MSHIYETDPKCYLKDGGSSKRYLLDSVNTDFYLSLFLFIVAILQESNT